MPYCTSSNLSNMWAKGRTEMSPPVLQSFSVPWTLYTGEHRESGI